MTLRSSSLVLTYSALDVQNRSASVACPTTPTDLIIPTVITQQGNITYNNSTGEITFLKAGIYQHILMLNLTATAARTIYAYAKIDTGGGYNISRYSSREITISNQSDGQVMYASNNYFPAGTKLIFVHWTSASCNMVSTDAPNTTPGTVTTPAIRLLYTSVNI